MAVGDAFYMQLALDAAWRYQALTYPNPPVGATLLDRDGKLLSIAAHTEAGKAHAELAACIEAVKVLGDRRIDTFTSPAEQHDYLCHTYAGMFTGATLYVTLEPCMHRGKTPPCSMLIERLGFSRVVIGSSDPNPDAAGGADYLRNRGVTVETGMLKEACDALLYPFLQWQRHAPFIFFKLAKHQNGTISGKHVSSQASRTLVHRIRAKIDLLVIGGDTVRIDRPTLDTRLIEGGRPPDILIYTSTDNLDRTIPLFNVPRRKVYVENHFDRIHRYRHIMIEGGEGMFGLTRQLVDYYLFFTTDRFAKGKKIDLDAHLQNLHSFKNDSDTIAWFKNCDKETP